MTPAGGGAGVVVGILVNHCSLLFNGFSPRPRPSFLSDIEVPPSRRPHPQHYARKSRVPGFRRRSGWFQEGGRSTASSQFHRVPGNYARARRGRKKAAPPPKLVILHGRGQPWRTRDRETPRKVPL